MKVIGTQQIEIIKRSLPKGSKIIKAEVLQVGKHRLPRCLVGVNYQYNGEIYRTKLKVSLIEYNHAVY